LEDPNQRAILGAITAMTIKEDLYRLVDELPESEPHAAKRYLEYLRNMGDPVLRAM
jgi:hypothetical protein